MAVDCTPRRLPSQNPQWRRIEPVRGDLTARLLTISQELSRGRRRTPADTVRILHARKAAEFSANLAAALGFSAPDLRRIKQFFPFQHLTFLGRRDVERLTPQLRREIEELARNGPVRGKRGRSLWPHIAELAARGFRALPDGRPLPYPSIQIVMNESGIVRLHALAGLSPSALEGVIPAALRDEGLAVGEPSAFSGSERVLLLGHFDPHGFAMLVATYLGLLARGLPEPACIIDYNSTGDYGKFWKRTLPHAVSEETDRAITLDLTVYWRRPERTLKGIRQVIDKGVAVTIVDHHFDTLFFARDIVRAGAELVLTDTPGCFLGERLGRRELPFAWLGALGDRDLPMRWHAHMMPGKADFPRQVPGVLAEVASLMHALSPPRQEIRKLKPFPTMELVRSAADGIRGLKAALRAVARTGYRVSLPEGDIWFRPRLNPVAQELSANGAEAALLGRVLLVSQPLQAQGRVWYDILERVLEAEPGAVYALAGRYLPGTGFNFLALKRWRELCAPAPLSFVRPRLRPHTIGHFEAFWVNLSDNASTELARLVRAMNAYFGVSGLRIRPVVERLLAKLVDARISTAEQVAHDDNHSE